MKANSEFLYEALTDAAASFKIRAEYTQITNEINRLLGIKKKVIIAIDGKCGAGKTTLANILSEEYGAPVINMDDFFLPVYLRTEERLSSPGGNVHYERFLDEVLKPASLNLPISYKVFDCGIMDFSDCNKTAEFKDLLIVEGSYSMRPEFVKYYDFKVFMDISSEEQKKRILKRNGHEAFKNFESRWIPMENEYFNHFNISKLCDIALI